ncbi:hypothetical protein CAP39_04385 [Sphingomonas sp. IBVSS1]|nr:hypothetical protein CAP39_04385 [Sphingomonas sp. IBVSS1]
MTQDRKAAIAAYKERKATPGIYLIRCSASGEAWVGSAPDLATIQNRHWFSLRQGGHTQPSLQQAWARHGEASFRFEIVETFAEPDSAPASHTALRDRVRHWAEQHGAKPI